MKLVLRFLSIVIAVSVLFSCNKESGDLKSIEGTWGLVHFETYTKINDELVGQNKYDCNPYAPVDEEDIKLVIFNTLENNYLFTIYYWDNDNDTWVSDSKHTVTINGSELCIAGQETYTFQFTSDSLTLEHYDENKYDDDYLISKRQHYVKMVFRRMADRVE